MPSFPAVFISHGSPLQALDGGRTADAWRALAAELPRPRAVLAVSAHWETEHPEVSAAAQPETIHDFGGFPRALFEIQYPAPGAPWLAERVRDLLSGFEAVIHPTRGLDHGAWVPLREMYPHADVPVAQLSIQPHLGPEHHVRIGRALAPLSGEGVLIVATGSLTHNLSDWRPAHRDAAGYSTPPLPYVTAFQEWMRDKLVHNDLSALIDYRQRAPDATRAHPSDEHLLPLYVAIGAGGSDVRRVHGDIKEAALAMDVYAFHSSTSAG
jgi:4,5-DOPA dioxygenase extradiol